MSNVGIGTGTPWTSLHVIGKPTNSNPGHACIVETNGNQGVVIRSIGVNQAELMFDKTRTAGATQTASIGTDNSNRSLFLSVNSNDRLRITNDGTVHVGTNYTNNINTALMNIGGTTYMQSNVGINAAPQNGWPLYVLGDAALGSKLQLGINWGTSVTGGSGQIWHGGSYLGIVGGSMSNVNIRTVRMWDDLQVVRYLSITGGSNLAVGPYAYLTANSNTWSSYNNNSGTSFASINCAYKVIASEFNAVSDMRVKDNIVNYGDDLCADVVSRLQPRHYTMKTDGMVKVGFIAQEVYQVFPNAISFISRDEYDDFHVLDYEQLIAVQAGAIRQLQKEVAELKSIVSQLVQR